ncbi:hypothetical protein BDV11DRAFT_174697 [Aspergillus similis]
MAAYNNRAEGGGRGKAWNSFGHLATRVNWKENRDVKSHRLLHTPDTKDVFTEEFSIMGAIVMYRRLKAAMVLTLKRGFPNPRSKGGRADTKFLILDKAEWDNSMVLLQKYADVLIGAGWFPVLDDINEDLLQYTVARHQLPADSPTPARLFGFKKSMPLGHKETVTEEVRKFRDKIIAPQEATPEEVERGTADKADENPEGEKNAPKEITECQGLDGDAELTVDDEGGNGNEVYDNNDGTRNRKRNLQQQESGKKGGKRQKKN